MNQKRGRKNRLPAEIRTTGTAQLPPLHPPPTIQHSKVTVEQAHWSGPLPSPQALERFEQVSPGAAAVIIRQFEAEAEHRRKLEDRDQRFIIRDSHGGQFLAGVFAAGALGLAAFAIAHEAHWVAALLGGGTIVAGITAFLRHRSNGNEK